MAKSNWSTEFVSNQRATLYIQGDSSVVACIVTCHYVNPNRSQQDGGSSEHVRSAGQGPAPPGAVFDVASLFLFRNTTGRLAGRAGPCTNKHVPDQPEHMLRQWRSDSQAAVVRCQKLKHFDAQSVVLGMIHLSPRPAAADRPVAARPKGKMANPHDEKARRQEELGNMSFQVQSALPQISRVKTARILGAGRAAACCAVFLAGARARFRLYAVVRAVG